MTFPSPSAPATDVDPFGGLDDLDGPPAPASLLDDVLDVLAAPADVQTVTWQIPTRPGFAVIYRTNVDAEDVKKAVRLAKKKGPGAPKNDVDEVVMCAIVLGIYNEGLLRGGVDVGLTFRSKDLLDRFGARRVADAVKQVYGADGPLISHARELTRLAGLTDDGEPLEAEDPTVA